MARSEQKHPIDFKLPSSKVGWFRRTVERWAKKSLRDFPWRHTRDSYAIFLAEFLLQQTDGPRVVPVYRQMLGAFPNLESLAHAEESNVGKLLEPLGFHFRAKRLIEAASTIISDPRFSGVIPKREEELLILPGVGPYIARSILANAFGRHVAVLDTNVARILQRFFGIESSRPRPRNDPLLWKAAQEIAPQKNLRAWNLGLIDFGTAVCTARKPHCSRCPLSRKCSYYACLIESTAS